MTEEELDKIAASLLKDPDVTETMRAKIPHAVSFLKSDPAAFVSFSELADALRDITDMKRLLGTDNEMFQELAGPASKRGTDAFSELMRTGNWGRGLAIALSHLAMAYANRGRKPERPKRKIRHEA